MVRSNSTVFKYEYRKATTVGDEGMLDLAAASSKRSPFSETPFAEE